MKSTCNSTDPTWKVHFGTFVISQTVIDDNGKETFQTMEETFPKKSDVNFLKCV
ncbi:hypothetical protein DPMN_060572 [Dreissena polymorpha]|uniref:Uncharacterized protein n=1 Tax=Dreissena polymorpha TaxID=45954 RepID=A0A9D4C5G6_DREPO|nr:hypothetical protein DPMN_060572 [Dreissena polymorpha]